MSRQDHKDAALADLVNQVNTSDISSIRNVVSGIIRIINDPRSTAKDLKDLIQVDPPLTAKVLRLANSAYYSPRKRISEIEQAVIWIGFDALKELTLRQKVCEIFQNDDSIAGYSRLLLWKHSVAVGIMAKLIYRREFGERGENAYAAGILHDIGIIAEDQFLQHGFRLSLKNAEQFKQNLHDAEADVFGFDHADIAEAIARDWKFPRELIAAMACHHRPQKAAKSFERIAMTLYLAEDTCRQSDMGYTDAPVGDSVMRDLCLGRLGIKPHALDLIRADMENDIAKMEKDGLF